MRIAVVLIAIIASLMTVVAGLRRSGDLQFRAVLESMISSPERGFDVGRDIAAEASRIQVGAFVAAGIGIAASALALLSVDRRRSAVLCGVFLLVAAVTAAVLAGTAAFAIPLAVAATLSFVEAFLVRGPGPAPTQLQSDADRPGDAPFGWVLLRIVGIFAYLFGAIALLAWISWPVYVVWRGYPFPQVTWTLQIVACLLSLAFLVVGLLLARRVANRFYASVEIPKGQFAGDLLAVPAGGILCWLAMARPNDDPDLAQLFFLVGIVLLLAVVIDGFVTVVRLKPFRWRIFILIGLGIGSASASLLSPNCFATHGILQCAYRSSTFAATISAAESSLRRKSLQGAVAERKQVRTPEDLKGALLVCDAYFDRPEAPCRLRVSNLERYLPQQWLAKNEESVRFVVVVAPFGTLPGFRFAWAPPFQVFDWPQRELIQQGTLRLCEPGQMPRQHYPDAVEGTYCECAIALAQQMSKGN